LKEIWYIINKTVLGFDFGMKRIGMAVGQTISMSASPLKTLLVKDGVPNWDDLTKVIKEWQPTELIVGIPVTLDGENQLVTFAAKKFSKKLKHRYQLPVHSEDERFTTIEARSLLFEQGGFHHLNKSEIDSIAAVLITEQWLGTNSA